MLSSMRDSLFIHRITFFAALKFAIAGMLAGDFVVGAEIDELINILAVNTIAASENDCVDCDFCPQFLTLHATQVHLDFAGRVQALCPLQHIAL